MNRTYLTILSTTRNKHTNILQESREKRETFVASATNYRTLWLIGYSVTNQPPTDPLLPHHKSRGRSVNLVFKAGLKWLKTRQLSQMKMNEVAPKWFKGGQESSAMVWGQKTFLNKFSEDELNLVLTLLDSKSSEFKYSTSAPPSSGPKNSVEGRP